MVTRHIGFLKPPSLLARAERVKVAYISAYPPRECGIATFCEDLVHATSEGEAFSEPIVIAMAGGARYHTVLSPGRSRGG